MKRIVSAFIAVLLLLALAGCDTGSSFSTSAYKAGGSSDKNIPISIPDPERFTLSPTIEPIEKIDTAAWDELRDMLQSEAIEPIWPVPTQPAETEAQEYSYTQMVWIPKTGSKYHSSSLCSNMKNPSYVSIDDAIAWGYGRCSKCW